MIIRLPITRAQDLFEKNGFAMAEEKLFRDVQVRSSEIGIRKIGLNDLWQSLKEGYGDFNATPAVGMHLALLFYLLFALLLTLFLVGENLLHLAIPMVTGFTLIGPVVSIALFEMSRRRERGLDVSWRSTFDFVHSASFAPILALSILVALCCLAVCGAVPLFRPVRRRPTGLGVGLCDQLYIVTTRRGAALIVYGIPLGFVFAFTALAIFGGRLSAAPG